MISRTYVQCLTCTKAITARIQVGHEAEQPLTFPCPHCGTDIKLTLILDEPPRVKILWLENCDAGSEEGKIVNVGVGFTIPIVRRHEDMYFPSFELPRLHSPINPDQDQIGMEVRDIFVGLGGLAQATKYWKIIHKVLRFHRIGRIDLRDAQLELFWESGEKRLVDVDDAILEFLLRMLAPGGIDLLDAVVQELKLAHDMNESEFFRLADHYDRDLKVDRFKAYSDIFAEYFREYTEYNQTLVYVRNALPLPTDALATSSSFETSKMYYGNAFEVLGSHLDLPAAINNIIAGRPYDQMKAMDMKKFRTISKASRTKCFAENEALSSFAAEYDSTIRNASHHRWFKLDDSRQNILYRSGGTGALHKMSYAEYLFRCNNVTKQLMLMACWELLFLQRSGRFL